MVALERVNEYSILPREAPEYIEPRPPAAWPQEGKLEVDKLVIRYAVCVGSLLKGTFSRSGNIETDFPFFPFRRFSQSFSRIYLTFSMIYHLRLRYVAARRR